MEACSNTKGRPSELHVREGRPEPPGKGTAGCVAPKVACEGGSRRVGACRLTLCACVIARSADPPATCNHNSLGSACLLRSWVGSITPFVRFLVTRWCVIPCAFISITPYAHD